MKVTDDLGLWFESMTDDQKYTERDVRIALVLCTMSAMSAAFIGTLVGLAALGATDPSGLPLDSIRDLAVSYYVLIPGWVWYAEPLIQYYLLFRFGLNAYLLIDADFVSQ